jgi:hypothetical protein
MAEVLRFDKVVPLEIVSEENESSEFAGEYEF